MRAAAAPLLGAALLGVLPRCSSAGKGTAPRPESGTALAAGEAVPNAGVVEPSGIAFHSRLGRFFVVGDEGTLAELDAQGGFRRASTIGANLEDVAVHEPTGHLVLLAEVSGELLVFDPDAGRVRSRWRLDSADLVGKRESARDGFEGLAFRAEPGRPGGGVFYLAHQRGPSMLVALAFDPSGAGGTIGASSVIARWRMEGARDLTAVTWSAAFGRLLVVADAEDQLLVVDGEGRVEARVPLPGVQQEGAWLDADGALWIADDRGARVVRHRGARDVIAAALNGAAVAETERKKRKKKG